MKALPTLIVYEKDISTDGNEELRNDRLRISDMKRLSSIAVDKDKVMDDAISD